MYRRVNQFTLLALLLAQGAAGQALQPQPKTLTIASQWVSTVSSDGKFTYAVCPVVDAKNGCRAPSDSSLLLLIDFKRSVPYIPIEQYLKHVEVSDVSITSAGIRGEDLVANYTASSSSVDRTNYSHDVYKSGWLKVSDGEKESYLVCPGSIAKIGKTDMASSYRCKLNEKLFPLKYLKGSIEEIRNRVIIKQSVMEIGNSIDVYSYMGTMAPVGALENYPTLETLKVIKASNETKQNGFLVAVYLFGLLCSLVLLKKLVDFLYNRYVNPTRPISPPNNSSTSTLVNELDQILYAENNTRSPAESEYALLMEYAQLRKKRSRTATNNTRIVQIHELLNLDVDPSPYVVRELARIRTLNTLPRRPQNSFSDEQIENARRLAMTNRQPSTSSSPTNDGTPTPRKGRKVYVD